MMISFCIITDGKEPEKLEAQLQSIEALGCEHEIIMAGAIPERFWTRKGRLMLISMPVTAAQGRLGAMRNAVAGAARGEWLVVTDDDMLFDAGWLDGMKQYGDDFDVLACRILNPDGTRYWDWKVHENGMNWLLEYNETDPRVSLTGGVTIMKPDVFYRVRWDEERGFNQEEDVDFTNRVKLAGFRIAFNPHALIVHDANYTQRGLGVFKESK